MSAALVRHRITSDEWERMARAGVFEGNRRLELLDGEAVEKMAVGFDHSWVVTFFTYFFSVLTRSEQAWLLVQNPVRISEYWTPEPDVALVRWQWGPTAAGHPTPTDTLLLVEVADSSYEIDRDVKLPQYARAGVTEVWLANIPLRRMEVYRDPQGDAYRYVRPAGAGETVAPLAFPDLRVNVDDVFARVGAQG